MTRAQFNEYLSKEIEKASKEKEDARHLAFLQCFEEFQKLPDVEEAIKASVRLAKANLAAELEKFLDNDTLLDGVCCISDSLAIIDKIKTKLKELAT